MPRLTDRFTNTELRGLLVTLLIMAAVIIVLAIRSSNMHSVATPARDTVTVFITDQNDSTILQKKDQAIKPHKGKRSKRKTAQDSPATRNPLDEPVPPIVPQ